MYKEPIKAARIAYEWHGGQWSALYSYAFTGARSWSQEHKEDLLDEIGNTLVQSTNSRTVDEKLARKELLWLKKHIEQQDVKPETNADFGKRYV